MVTVSGGTPTLATDTDYNITSITDSGTGLLTITIATDFSSATWICVAQIEAASTGNLMHWINIDDSLAAGSVLLQCWTQDPAVTAAATLTDPTSWHMAGFGDQA
jgi:hypothetical protein